jgi:hypothetical protein
MRRATVLVLLSTGCLNPRSVGANADQCGSCHTDQQAALDTSAHGPERTPLFSKLHDAADSAACDSCHTPEPGLHPGLDCTTCHAAVGNAGEGAGQVVLDWSGPVRGPSGAAGGPHDTEKSAFLRSGELCGTCHDVDGPTGFVETTFTEWSESPMAEAGVTCVDCHFSNHRLRGLQADGAALVADTLLLEATDAQLFLTNRNAAHAVPAGAAWSRRLVLELDVGDPIVLSPRLSRDGRTIDSPLRADRVESRSLDAGETRSWPWPEGATTARLMFYPVAPGLGASSAEHVAIVRRPDLGAGSAAPD